MLFKLDVWRSCHEHGEFNTDCNSSSTLRTRANQPRGVPPEDIGCLFEGERTMKLRNEQLMTPSAWPRLTTCENLTTGAGNGYTVTFHTSTTPMGERVVAAHGQLTITQWGEGDPDWRGSVRHHFGVTCDLASNLAGKLICPHTKKVIPVSRFAENLVFWCDHEHKIALPTRQRITYDSPTAPPVAEKVTKFTYSFNNAARTKAFMARLQPILNEAYLRFQLAGKDYLPHLYNGVVKSWLANVVTYENIVDCESGQFTPEQVDLLAAMHQQPGVMMDDIKQLTADIYTATSLGFEP